MHPFFFLKYIAGWTGEVPAWSHKPENGGSNPSPATRLLFLSICTMVTFFGALADLICTYVDLLDEEEKRLAEQNRVKKEKERYEKECKYEEIWNQATKESHENPDEWKILPYGWSPFGIFI